MILRTIGVGAGEILCVRKNLAWILPNMPEKYFKISDLQKRTNLFIPIWAHFMSIWSLRAPLFSNQKLLDAICAQMLQSFRKFPEILPGFYGISRGFCQIKTFGGAIAAPAPRLLHQC